MQALIDIVAKQDKQTAEIKALRSNIEQLTAYLKQIEQRPIQIDSEAVSQRLMQSGKLTESIGQLNQVISRLPQSVEVKEHKIWSISLPTKLWVAMILLAMLVGFYFGPPVVHSFQYQYTKSDLELRERQIENFRNRNPDTAKKYFGE